MRKTKLLKKTVDGLQPVNQNGAANTRTGRKRVKPHNIADDDADEASDGDFDPSKFN